MPELDLESKNQEVLKSLGYEPPKGGLAPTPPTSPLEDKHQEVLRDIKGSPLADKHQEILKGLGYEEPQAVKTDLPRVETDREPSAKAAPASLDDARLETKLHPEEETKFQKWFEDQHKAGNIKEGDYRHYKEHGYGAGYDFRAAYEKGLKPTESGHWSDYGKKPSHETFSVESKYANEPGARPGRWEGEQYIPGKPPQGLPEALAPSKPYEPGPVTQFASAVSDFPAKVMHGFLRGGEQVLDIPRRIVQGDWDWSTTPHVLSAITGKAVSASEQYQAKEGMAKWVGNIMGMVGGFMLPVLGLRAVGYELPYVGATLMQRFGSNLITFGLTDAMAAKGAGGGDEEAKSALLKSVPTAALFTLAQAIPFDKLVESPGFINAVKTAAQKTGIPLDKLAESPWLSKFLEMPATGTAFAGAAYIQGQRDPAFLAADFLTGMGLHFATGVAPAMAGMKLEKMRVERQGKELERRYNEFVDGFKKDNNLSDEDFDRVMGVFQAINDLEQAKQAPGPDIDAPATTTGDATEAQRYPGAELYPDIPSPDVAKMVEAYRQGEEQPILSETLPPEVLEGIKAGKPLKPEYERKLMDAMGVSKAVAGQDLTTKTAWPVSPGGRTTQETPPEAIKLSESPAPKATPKEEPPSSAPARAGGGGVVGVSATPAEEKPVTTEKPTGPPTPMGAPGATAEDLARKPEITPPPTLGEGEIAPSAKPGEAVLGLTPEEAKTKDPWSLPEKKKKAFDIQKALESNNIPALIAHHGHYSPNSLEIKGLPPEYQKRALLLSRKGKQGLDSLFTEMKADYPQQMAQFEDVSDFAEAIGSGDLYKRVDRGKLTKDEEFYNEAITAQADKYGVTPEGFAQIEADAKREVAAERDTIAGEPSAGTPDRHGIAEAAFGIKPKFRLTEATPGGITPAELKRLYPDISEEQATILAQDPELRTQFAKGNWEAVRQIMAQQGVSDLGAQRALPGMGRQDTLFRAGEEAAFTQGLTTEQIKRRLGNYGTVSEIAKDSLNDKYTRGWLIRLKISRWSWCSRAKMVSWKSALRAWVLNGRPWD